MPRPTPTMEMLYLYDESRFEEPKAYIADPLFADIDREMQMRTEDAQIDFLMDLAGVQMALPFKDHNQNVINNYILNYFVPLDESGDLKKDVFENRMKKLEEQRAERIYIPQGEFSLSQKGKHSDEWIAQQFSLTKAGQMEIGLFNVLLQIADLSNTFKKAYDGMECGEIFRDISIKNQARMLNAMPEDRKEMATEGWRYIRTVNGHKYSEEEEATQEALKEKDKASGALLDINHNEEHEQRYNIAGAMACYGFARDTNLSFISNPGVYNTIQEGFAERKDAIVGEVWNPDRHQDRIMDDLNNLAIATSDVIFSDKINGYRIFDSKEFNTIKDDIKLLQRDLKKGNDLHNLKEINASLETFSQHCQDYLDKNQGTRFHKRGNERKKIVHNLKRLLDEQRQELQKHFGEKLKNLDNEWMEVTKTVSHGKAKIQISYADLDGNKKDLKNKFPKNSEPANAKAKNGPEI